MTEKTKRQVPLHLMLIPGLVIVFIFVYLPLFGSAIAFQNYSIGKGVFESDWVGLKNFKYVMNLPGFWDVIRNTIYIAFFKIIGNIIAPLTVALLLNELRHQRFKRTVQTIIYLPYYLSWVILSGIFIDILSPSTGVVNLFLQKIGIEPIFFLGDKVWFPITLISTGVWRQFGFGTVIYLAALTSIDPSLYEAAEIDGANRWQQTFHVTIPGIVPIIILMTVLGMGNILNAGFDQVYNMLSPAVYETGDIIDTFVYRLGMEQMQYSLSTAVGLVKSVVSLIFIAMSYYLADRLANYRIF